MTSNGGGEGVEEKKSSGSEGAAESNSMAPCKYCSKPVPSVNVLLHELRCPIGSKRGASAVYAAAIAAAAAVSAAGAAAIGDDPPPEADDIAAAKRRVQRKASKEDGPPLKRGREEAGSGGASKKGEGREEAFCGGMDALPSVSVPPTQVKQELNVLTWNIDGLDERHWEARLTEMCSILLQMTFPQPDVVLLQEVTLRMLPKLDQTFGNQGYTILGKPLQTTPHQEKEDDRDFCPYFTLAMVRTVSTMGGVSRRVPFAETVMGRDVLEVEMEFNGLRLLVLTSHFESGREESFASVRKAQFRSVLERLTSFEGPAVFAGDTNLRVPEVKAESLSKQVTDAFEELRSDKKEKGAGSTFNTFQNWNTCEPHEVTKERGEDGKLRKVRVGGTVGFGARFDRFFINKGKGVRVSQQDKRLFPDNGTMGWIGTELIEDVDMHPSDHWGLSLKLEVGKLT